MATVNGGSAEFPELPLAVSFYYLKSPDYRQIHVDGVVGGVTPRGLIHMAVFSEHFAIPQKTVQSVEKGGSLGSELTDQRISRDGIVRDLAAGLVLDEATAHQLIDWLQMRLVELKKVKQAVEEIAGAENNG